MFPLKSSINIKSDSVDKWMKKLEELIGESLYKAIRDGNYSYNTMDREQWFLEHHSQVLSVVVQIVWTETCENYLIQMSKSKINFLKKAPPKKRKPKASQMPRLSGMMSDNEEEMYEIQTYLDDYYKNLSTLIGLVKNDLSPQRHKIVVGLITSEVHNRDMLDMLQTRDIRSVSNFNWEQQLR